MAVDADIKLLFDVARGGAEGEDSEKLIQKSLEEIITNINKRPLGVLVKLDKASAANLQKEIQSALTKASKNYKVEINAVKLSDAAKSSFKKQLQQLTGVAQSSTGKAAKSGTTTRTSTKNSGSTVNEAELRKAAQAAASLEGKLSSIRAVQRNISSGFAEVSKNATMVSDNASLETMREKYEQLSAKIAEVNALKRKSPDLVKPGDIAKIVELQTELTGYITTLRNEINVKREKDEADKRDVANKEREAAQQSKVIARYGEYYSLLMRIQKERDSWTASRSGRSADSYNELTELIPRLEALNERFETGKITAVEFNNELRAFGESAKRNEAAIRASGEATKTWGERIGSLSEKFATWFSITRVIMALVRTIRQMISETIELDSAMTQLEVVTHANESAMREYGDTIARTAKRIGSSITDLVDSTTVYARLGYSLDEASTLAEYTAMLQNVGDIDVEDAQNAVTAIVKAYGKGVADIETIMDEMVKVGNNFPISVSQLAEGMNNAGSALSSAGNTFEQSLALLAAANTTVQNISKASTGLRTIAARIRNTKTELDEMGEAMTEADYENLVSALTKANVALTNVDGSFRSTYDILEDVAAVWHSLSSDTQAALAETLAGTRQQNIFYSLIEQFGEASGAMESMKDSTGELESAYAIYMESIQAHISQFKAAFQELSQTVFGSGIISDIVDFGTALVGIIRNIFELTNALGGLKTILMTIAGIVAVKKWSAVSTKIIAWFTSAANAISGMATAWNTYATTGTAAAAVSGRISMAFGTLTTSAVGMQLAVGGAIAAFIALAAIVKVADAAYQKANPSLETLKERYDETKQKVDSLNDELETSKSRIIELQELANNGEISLVEEEELKRLRRQNELLEQQLRIQRELLGLDQNNLYDAASRNTANWLSNAGSRTYIANVGHGVTTEAPVMVGAAGLLNSVELYSAARERGDRETMETYLASFKRLQDEAIKRRNALDPNNAEQIAQMDELLDRAAILFDSESAVKSIFARFFGSEDDLNPETIQAFTTYLEQLDYDISKITPDMLSNMFSATAAAAGDAANSVAGFNKQMEALSELQKRVSALSAAFTDMVGGDKQVSFASLSGLAEQFGDVKNIDEYISRIAAMYNNADGLTDVLNELFDAFVAQKVAAGELSEADEEVVEAMLREAGVANADKAAHELLTAAKSRLEAESILAEKGLDGVITALQDETAYAGGTRAALIQLAAQMVQTNNTKMSFSEQIQRLNELGRQAGITSALIAAGFENNRQAMHGFERPGDMEAFIARYVNQISAAASKVKFDIDYSLPSGYRDNNGSNVSKAKNEVEEYIVSIDRFRDAIRRLNEETEKRETIEHNIGLAGSLEEEIDLQNRLIDAYGQEQAALHALNEERDAAIHEESGRLTQLGFNVEYDDVNNKFWVSNLEHINELNGKTAESTNELRKEAESLIKSLEEWNEANADNSASWVKLQESITDAKKRIVEAYRDIVKQSSESVDSIQNIYDVLHKAANEYAANGGFISVDAFQEIIALGPQYMQFLQDQNGELTITDEKINRIIASKTEELALEQALTYVERLRLAMQKGSVEDLNELLSATTDASGATWNLVYANLALLDLDEKQYAAAKHNIDAIRALANTAIGSIGKTAGAFTDTLSGMKSGLDDILKYVMDMLKQRVEDQIDALNDMKDAYADIIAKRKESLDNTKKETDYQKKIASKTQELARLQTRLNALSMDDSREAKAQRAKLSEELAKLQEELAEEQADHARDVQKDALDEMQKAYEDEKDAEIDKLKDSVSSTEKLYRMAIDYIGNHWDTLYRELIDWNYECGNSLESEIVSAWENALAAAQRYGSFVGAMKGIDSDIAFAGGDTHNDLLGNRADEIVLSNSDYAHAIANNMRSYASQWSKSNTAEKNADLHKKAADEAKKLKEHKTGVDVEFDSGSGIWRIISDTNNPDNVGKNFLSTYHSGGIAGDNATLKQNEMLAKLERGEAILDQKKQSGVYRLVDFATVLSEKLSRVVNGTDMLSVFNSMSSGIRSLQNQAIGAMLSAGGGGNVAFNPVISVNINHNGTLTERDAQRYGRLAADSALQELGDAFSKRGIKNLGGAILK